MARAARLDASGALSLVHGRPGGLAAGEVAAGRRVHGSNALPSHEAGAWQVLLHQLNSPLLLLLAATAVVAFALGDHTDAVIIAIILTASVGLGFLNEYRAARTAQTLHTRIEFTTVVTP